VRRGGKAGRQAGRQAGSRIDGQRDVQAHAQGPKGALGGISCGGGILNLYVRFYILFTLSKHLFKMSNSLPKISNILIQHKQPFIQHKHDLIKLNSLLKINKCLQSLRTHLFNTYNTNTSSNNSITMNRNLYLSNKSRCHPHKIPPRAPFEVCLLRASCHAVSCPLPCSLCLHALFI